jgi:hypothetical protein
MVLVKNKDLLLIRDKNNALKIVGDKEENKKLTNNKQNISILFNRISLAAKKMSLDTKKKSKKTSTPAKKIQQRMKLVATAGGDPTKQKAGFIRGATRPFDPIDPPSID